MLTRAQQDRILETVLELLDTSVGERCYSDIDRALAIVCADPTPESVDQARRTICTATRIWVDAATLTAVIWTDGLSDAERHATSSAA